MAQAVMALHNICVWFWMMPDGQTYWSVIYDGEKVAQIEHSYGDNRQAKIELLQSDRTVKDGKMFFQYEKQERFLG